MKTILMNGPGISDPSQIVEREVPEADVQAYKAAGYVEGGLPKEEVVEVEEAPKKKGKKK